jgi:hypothetical protein
MKDKMKLIGGRDMYDKLPKTKRKLARDQFGPKQINNFDRQQIKHFVTRIDNQNHESSKRLLYVNRDMHHLLRGNQVPEVIQETDNE